MSLDSETQDYLLTPDNFRIDHVAPPPTRDQGPPNLEEGALPLPIYDKVSGVAATPGSMQFSILVYAWVSAHDLPRLSQYRWIRRRSSRPVEWIIYASRHVPGTTAPRKYDILFLPRVVYSLTKYQFRVYHRDKNYLHCTRSNLKLSPQFQGVSELKQRGPNPLRNPWQAILRNPDRGTYGLGTYPTEIQAAYAINYAAIATDLTPPNPLTEEQEAELSSTVRAAIEAKVNERVRTRVR